jgi:Ca2+-transporting ATPase
MPPDIAFTKGSVDSLLAVASQIWDKGQSRPLDQAMRQKILADNDQLARNGMRVLGIAFRLLNAQIVDGEGNRWQRGADAGKRSHLHWSGGHH